jgi:phospholipid transport system substrate-binding protein
MIRFVPVLALLVLLGLAPARGADPQAAAPIEALNQSLLDVMHAGQATPFAQRYAALAPVVERTFDLDSILETSVGPRWQSYSPTQQQQLREDFAKFTVTSYVANFSSFNGERFEISPDTRAIGSEQVVETKIIQASGDAARIDYVMRPGPGGWRVVDVLLDGSISRVAVQRSDFRSLIASGPEPLIQSLERKNADLSGHASAR